MDDCTRLLDNMLDSLDRLFDRKSGVIDVYTIAYASALALREHRLSAVFEEAAESLEGVVRAGLPDEASRELALEVTDALRIALADALPFVPGPRPSGNSSDA